MLDFTEKDIIKYYNLIKRHAHKLFEKKEYEKCLKYIETAASIANNFNWKYSDSEFEKLLSRISLSLLPTNTNFSSIKGRFVFYDYYAVDNKGLTQQYIRALMSWDVEFLFLFEGSDLSASTQILQELQNYKKAEIFTLPSGEDRIHKIKTIYNKIANYRPEKILMHLAPNDVIAITSLAAFPDITKYQINLTDHAFWLGTNITDFSIEFRNYGRTVSLEKRGLYADRLLLQPFYPIIDCESFKGLPNKIPPGKIIIFSGGSYYKIYGENYAFFAILKRLLNENPSVVILFAGSGNEKPFREFIKQNNYDDRLFLIGNRDDINHVFSSCDIYLSTFPFCGGLMTQYAAINSKPILAFTNTNLPGNFIEDFLPNGAIGNEKIVFKNLDEMMKYANRLIENKEFRQDEGRAIKSRVINPETFNKDLLNLITTNINNIPFKRIEIDYKYFSSFYLESENLYLNNMPLYFVASFKFLAIFLFPKATFKFVFKIFFDKNELQKVLRKTFNSIFLK